MVDSKYSPDNYKPSKTISHISSAEMGILSVDFNNINLEDLNFYEYDPETIIHVRFMAWRNRL